MANMKLGSEYVFLLVYVQYCLAVSQIVGSGLSEMKKNEVIIYDISQLVDDSMEEGKENWARDLLQNVLKDEEVYLHYETGTEIHDLAQLSNVVKMVKKITFPSENPQINIFISVRNSITSFKIPASDTTNMDSIKTTGHFGIIFQIDCKETSNLTNEYSSLLSSLRSREILVRFHHQTTSCLLPKAGFTEADFVFNVANFTTQIGFPESYTIFKNHLQSRAEQNPQIKDLISYNFYLRLDSFSKGIPPEADIEYNLLLLQFGKRWSQESGSSVIIRFSSPTYFSKLTETKRTKRSVSRSSVVIPWLQYNLPVDATQTYLLGALDKISSLHQRIYVNHAEWETIANTLDQLKPGLKLSQPLKATVWVGKNLDDSNKTVVLKDKMTKRNILLDNLDFGQDVGSQKPSMFENVVGGIPVLCRYDFEYSAIQPATVVQKMREVCGFIFEQATAFIWRFHIDYSKAAKENYSLEFYTGNVQQRLNEALLARKEIRGVKANVNVQLVMWSNNLPSKDPTFNFYCDETLLRINAYVEAVRNWARIHDFPVLIFNIFPDLAYYQTKITWWSIVQVSSEVSQEITKNTPVYVLRNFGDTSPNPNWKVNSCVKWSAEVAQEGMELDKDLTGATLPMNFRDEPLSHHELETMLLFTIQKFVTVELLLRNDAIRQLRDLKTLNTLLGTHFLKNLVEFDVLGGRLYIEISVDSTFFSETIKQVEKVANKLSNGPKLGLQLMGIHLRNWESEISPEALVKQVVSLGLRYDFEVGLVVKNCASLLNNLATSKNWTSVPPSEYILCPTTTFPAENENKEEFSRNLDTNLYISKIFEKFLPGRSIYFRVNSSPCCDGDTKEKETQNLLRFLNDVSQFAVGNKLKHFIVQAFGSSSSSSWFHAENYADLSNASTINDRENVFRRKSLVTPLPPPRWIEKFANKLKNESLQNGGALVTTSSCTANASQPSLDPSLNYPAGNTEQNLTKSKMQCSREEVFPCRPLIPVGFGYSFQNHVILTQNKILQLEQVPHSEIALENENGFNVTQVDKWRSCYKVFRSEGNYLKATMRAFGVSPNSFPVESFGKAVFQKHPCFNLLPLDHSSSPLGWNSFSATVDFVTVSIGINESAKLEPQFVGFLSRLKPPNTTDRVPDLSWSLIFEFYGTHVVTRADLGGSIQIQLEVKEAEDDSEEIDETEKLSILGRAVENILHNLQLAERENVTVIDFFTIDPRVIFTLSQTGGNPIYHFSNFSDMNSVTNVRKWKESLEQFAVILPTSLKLLPLEVVVSQYGHGVPTQIPTWIKNAVGVVFKDIE